MATEYTGPVEIARLEFAGKPIALVRPADPDRMLDDPVVRELNQRDDYMPYWAYLWPGACLLAEAVSRELWPTADPRSRKIDTLEIGCGVGLAGLVALGRGLRVCFSDYDPAPLQFVVRSVRENGFDESRHATRILDWRALPDEVYPLILGSDVLYERRLVPLVANLLAVMLAPGGMGLISCPGRSSAAGFEAELAARGLECGVEPTAWQGRDEPPVRGLIYRVRRPVGSESVVINPARVGSGSGSPGR